MLAEQHGGGDFSPYWGDSDTPPFDDFDFCDCPGPPPPPKFVIPPPPPSPSSPLCQGAHPTVSGTGPHQQQDPPFLQFCSLEPVGAEFTQTAFPSLPIIAVCSSIVLVAVLVASFLLWKHKRKVQNFLPCKSQGRCDIPVGSTPGITYDDVLINHHPTRLPPNHHQNPQPPHLTTTDTLTPIELLDVKYGSYIQKPIDTQTRTNFTAPTSNKERQGILPTVRSGENLEDQRTARGTQQHGHRRRHHGKNSQGNHPKKKDHFHPIYEEVSAASDDKINSNGHSYDSDIEDSEIESRTIGSEDEFAEDELSVAGEFQPATSQEAVSQPDSATSSLQGSTGGDLYPDVVTGSKERFCAPQNTEPRTLKNVFRGLELGSGLKKHTHSLERNKDGHPSNSFQAKQNYYLNKSMLGPDFTFRDGEMDCSQTTDFGQSHPDVYMGARGIGSSLNFLPHILQQQQRALLTRSTNNSPPPPPYAACTNTRPMPNNQPKREIISALYNPHIVSPTMMSGRLPDAIMRELAYKLPGNQSAVPMMAIPSTGAKSSRSLPVPPSCRSGGTGMLFTLDNPYPPPPTYMSRTRSGSATEFNLHPYQQQQQQQQHSSLSGGRPPTPPPPENIYASIDDEGLFTIDGSRHRSVNSFVPSRKASSEFRNTFGRSRPLTSKIGSSDGNVFESSANNDRRQDPSESYGDIRSNYESRTPCS